MGALRAALDRRDDPDAREELADLDSRLAELARMWGERPLTGTEWAAAKAPLDARRQTLLRQIEASPDATALRTKCVGRDGDAVKSPATHLVAIACAITSDVALPETMSGTN